MNTTSEHVFLGDGACQEFCRLIHARRGALFESVPVSHLPNPALLPEDPSHQSLPLVGTLTLRQSVSLRPAGAAVVTAAPSRPTSLRPAKPPANRCGGPGQQPQRQPCAPLRPGGPASPTSEEIACKGCYDYRRCRAYLRSKGILSWIASKRQGRHRCGLQSPGRFNCCGGPGQQPQRQPCAPLGGRE